MSEEACESGGEDAIAEEQSQEEYNGSSEYIESSEDANVEEAYQESRHPDKPIKSKAERALEKKLGKPIRAREHNEESYNKRDIEELIQDRELTEEERAQLEQYLEGDIKEAKYFPAGVTSISGYIKAWKSQDKATVKDGLKGLGYLIKGFIDVEGEGDKDVYEKIAYMENDPILYISGAFEYPMNISEIEKYSGYDIAHIKERMDPDKIDDIIEYTIRVTGKKPIVLGFSDGGASIRNYIEKHGMDKVSMFYALAADKFDVENPDKLKFIDGNKDRLFILGKDAFKKTNSEVFKINGGHTWMCYDPITIQQIFDVIEKTARVERHNFESFDKAA